MSARGPGRGSSLLEVHLSSLESADWPDVAAPLKKHLLRSAAERGRKFVRVVSSGGAELAMWAVGVPQ